MLPDLSSPASRFPLLPNCLVGSLLPRDGKPRFHSSRKLASFSLALHSNNTISEFDLLISYRQLMPSRWGFPPNKGPWSSVAHARRACKPGYVGAACQPVRPSKGRARESARSRVQMWCSFQASFFTSALEWLRLDATEGNSTWATENKWLLYAFQTSVMMTRFLWLYSTPPCLPFAILKKLLIFSPSAQNFPLAAGLVVTNSNIFIERKRNGRSLKDFVAEMKKTGL